MFIILVPLFNNFLLLSHMMTVVLQLKKKKIEQCCQRCGDRVKQKMPMNPDLVTQWVLY